MITVLTGPNDYMLQEYIRELTAAFVAEHGDFGIENIEAGNIEFGRLLEVVSSMPFLSNRRMVIVRDLNANKSLQENIEQFINAISETTDVVLIETKFDKRLTLYKTLKKHTDFYEFTELNEHEIAKWVSAYALKSNGIIKPNDSRYLVERVGYSQTGLKHELDKLLSYDIKITKSSIDLLTEPLPRSSVFDLLDAAFAGNKQKAMSLYEDQRKQQVEPQAIMGMIAWQLHIMAVVKMNEKLSIDDIARQAKLNPFVVRKAQNITRTLSEKQTRDLVGRALALDVRLKSELIDADDAVQHFLLTAL